MNNNLDYFISKLDKDSYKLNEPLASHTTVRIGGPTDIWYESKDTEDFINKIKLAREYQVPVSVLGRGANVLIGDKGIRGLVIKNGGKDIHIGNELTYKTSDKAEQQIQSRWESATELEGARTLYEFKDLDYDESSCPHIEVRIDSGVDMPFASNFLIQRGITGLQWYSRIPGTLGGWIHNNVHGGSHFISDVIKDVTVLDENNNIVILNKDELNIDYDKSRFHDFKEIIISATLELFQGDEIKAKAVMHEWGKRKSIQPAVSVGCVFQNISQELREKFNYPTTSVGYIIEHILHMSGFRIGDAVVSPKHSNFIVNEGNATAQQYLEIIQEIQARTKQKLKLDLKTEIFLMGEF